MNYQSNLRNVLSAIDRAEDRALTAVGTFVRSEAQVRSPVQTGNLRDSNDFQVDNQGKKVIVGNSVEYGLWVHEGSSKQRSQPWLENSVMENVSRIKSLISEMLRL
ncbi:MAG: phage protein gp10 family [Neobacillus sp.]|nr:phage protein gp10 family [Neobacillus sp.]